ncbi:hypothetical protein [Pseudogemmobacter sonorensis]|uniref:hypothetical protein n=1 Tax=Pseudogemmobacter sonorensis TaxID=2989681 RepID=UPI0036C1A443
MTAPKITVEYLTDLLKKAGPAMDDLHRISAEDWGVEMPDDGGWTFVGKRENHPRLIVIERGFGDNADQRQDAIEALCILAPTLARKVIAAEKLREAGCRMADAAEHGAVNSTLVTEWDNAIREYEAEQ